MKNDRSSSNLNLIDIIVIPDAVFSYPPNTGVFGSRLSTHKINLILIPLILCFVNTTATTWGSYRQVSNIRRTLVGNKIFDNSDVVGASPVGPAPTTSSLST